MLFFLIFTRMFSGLNRLHAAKYRARHVHAVNHDSLDAFTTLHDFHDVRSRQSPRRQLPPSYNIENAKSECRRRRLTPKRFRVDRPNAVNKSTTSNSITPGPHFDHLQPPTPRGTASLRVLDEPPPPTV